MQLFSGRRSEPSDVVPDHEAVPAVTDIALSLGRSPRYGGHTRQHWPVICHLFVCQRIAEDMGLGERMQFLAMMHDAHEAVTVDVPAFYKPDILREWQKEIDERLYKALDVWPLSKSEKTLIEEIDTRALRAEAKEVGPPGIMAFFQEPIESDVEIVRATARLYRDPRTTNGLESPAAERFYQLYGELIGAAVKNRVDHTTGGGFRDLDTEEEGVKNAGLISALVPLAKELAEGNRNGITITDVRKEALERGILTGEESAGQLSALGHVMSKAGLVNVGTTRRSDLDVTHGVHQVVWFENISMAPMQAA